MSDFPKLVNSHDDSVIPITNSTFSIGRSLSCDHIIQCLGVSRFHCIIKKNNNKWTLYDRSTNGTMVNSNLCKFNESIDLNPGDVIKLGPQDLDFVFTSSSLEPQVEVPVAIGAEATILAEEFEKPFDEAPTQVENPKPESGVSDVMENELTCSICSELFVKAVTLNCSHTYCKYCIGEWRKNKSTCPICRKTILTVAPTLVLDNFIEKFVGMQSKEVQEGRKGLVKHREEVTQNAAGSSNSADGAITIDMTQNSDSEHDLDEVYSDYSDEDDLYTDWDEPAPYYGGYGRCYVCNQAGHWANSCPFKVGRR